MFSSNVASRQRYFRLIDVDTPPPTSGQLSTNPYYEIMVAGNVWLPEDLLYGIAKHSDVDGLSIDVVFLHETGAGTA